MKIERESAFIDLLTMEMNKVIVGQKHMIERLLIGLWTRTYWKVFRD
jgi:MoxR-like ATPase